MNYLGTQPGQGVRGLDTMNRLDLVTGEACIDGPSCNPFGHQFRHVDLLDQRGIEAGVFRRELGVSVPAQLLVPGVVVGPGRIPLDQGPDALAEILDVRGRGPECVHHAYLLARLQRVEHPVDKSVTPAVLQYP